jgi:hypothetical protein
MADYHLAQVNIGIIRGPIDGPSMAGFVARLDEINAVADAAPGFVWRLQTEEGNATSLHVFDNEYMLINMSVWESVEALYEYVYRSSHAELIKGRKDWFEPMDTPIMTLWWIPAGHIPTPEEAKQRLTHLEQHGPTPLAFTFKQPFTVEEMSAATSKV